MNTQETAARIVTALNLWRKHRQEWTYEPEQAQQDAAAIAQVYEEGKRRLGFTEGARQAELAFVVKVLEGNATDLEDDPDYDFFNLVVAAELEEKGAEQG
jgi:hypothetical protein